MQTTLQRMWRPFLAVVLGISFSLGGLAGTARAASSLKDEMGQVAKRIHNDIKVDQQQNAVAVGDITGPAQLNTNFGPGLADMLRQELTALQMSVSNDASLSIKGRYARIEDKDSRDHIVVKLTLELLDQNDDVKNTWSAIVRDNASIAQAMGANVNLPSKASRNDRNEKIKEALEKPNVLIDGTRVKTTRKSPYAVEVIVNGKPRTPTCDDRGNPFVDIKRDEIYHVRVYNDSSSEAAVALSIDGLDQFHFSKVRDPKTNKPKYSNYIVGANNSFTIEGWHKDNSVVDQFKVVAYGTGAASQARVSGKTGILTVTFRVAATNAEELPEDDGGRSATENETGFGPPKQVNLKEVSRVLGVERDIISIRYSR